MIISELIAKLEILRKAHGDLEVWTESYADPNDDPVFDPICGSPAPGMLCRCCRRCIDNCDSDDSSWGCSADPCSCDDRDLVEALLI